MGFCDVVKCIHACNMICSVLTEQGAVVDKRYSHLKPKEFYAVRNCDHRCRHTQKYILMCYKNMEITCHLKKLMQVECTAAEQKLGD